MMHTELALRARRCLAEPALLMSVMDNLYSNAVHYGAESGNIRIHSYRHGEQVRIDVANSGEPIPAAEKNMIFEPFYQGSHQRKGAVKGSGLGLSIARDCVRQMQGSSVWLTPPPGRSVFALRFPQRRKNPTNESISGTMSQFLAWRRSLSGWLLSGIACLTLAGCSAGFSPHSAEGAAAPGRRSIRWPILSPWTALISGRTAAMPATNPSTGCGH
jgi:hypothetical protein